MLDESGVLLFSNLTDVPVTLFLEVLCDEVPIPARTTVELHFPNVADLEGLEFGHKVVIWSMVDQIRVVGSAPNTKPLYVMDKPLPPGGNPERATKLFIENGRWRSLRLMFGPDGEELIMPPETHFRLQCGRGGIERVTWQESAVTVEAHVKRVERAYWSPTAALTRLYFETWPTRNERFLPPLARPRSAHHSGLRVLIEPTNQNWGKEKPRRPLPEYLRATLRDEVPGMEPRLRWYSAVLDEPFEVGALDGKPPMTVSELVLRCADWERAEMLPLRPWNSKTPGVDAFAPRVSIDRIPDPVALERDLDFIVHAAVWPEPTRMPDGPSLYKQGIDQIVAGAIPTVWLTPKEGKGPAPR